jgi:hypothetical protein
MSLPDMRRTLALLSFERPAMESPWRRSSSDLENRTAGQFKNWVSSNQSSFGSRV